MKFELQPTLSNELIKIQPLQENDFETLYKIASDPLLWEQHPNKDRYKRDVFENFFKGAMESGGAFLVLDNTNGEVIGCSRYYYDFNEKENAIVIGYTFIARSHWGKGFNKALKNLMLTHAFKFVDAVLFHIGANNIRSQKAIGNIGAKKIGEIEMEYYSEAKKLNFIYSIKKDNRI
ncbi:MAG TPA: GNAT family N-acetyltransferase [Bacteroidia bacterium]|jgi:RimJ/RimL family protein N-acetyltransferase|nr:GNAT family N-acetyltransferase [Bacteroidia bacterium]